MILSSRKRSFLFIIIFSLIFLLTFVGLYFLGFIPEELTGKKGLGLADKIEDQVIDSFAKKSELEKGELPISLSIPDVSISTTVINSESTDAASLNNDLKEGAVRYPGSGMLGKGNLFIFGHSADPKIYNGYFLTFYGLEKLKGGESIFIESESFIYEYKVSSVKLSKTSEVYVDFSKDENLLTLVTCSAFGKKEDRYVVEAKFVGKKTF
jgi:LPXTG-site transpeptidase (sortase) family protein